MARGAAPKRSRSARGPPRLHHLDGAAGEAEEHVPDRRLARPVEELVELRGQHHLRKELISDIDLLGVTPCTSSSVRPSPPAPPAAGRRVGSGSATVFIHQVALHPDVDQADEQDADEDQDLRQREEALPLQNPVAEDREHRIDERDLDVEDHEDQRDQVKADVEVDPGVAGDGSPHS